MTTLFRYAVLAVAAITLVACDTDQPTQLGTADAVLSIEAGQTSFARGNMWEIWEDTTSPPNGTPDRPKRAFQPNGPILHRCETTTEVETVPYPWGFSVEVSIVRAGSSRPVVLSTTTNEAQRYSAVTVAPSDAIALPDDDNDPTPPGDTTYATEYYRNGKNVNGLHPDFATFCLDQPLDPNMGPDLDNPAVIALNKGDTIIVQARKASANVNPVFGGSFPNPVLTGVVKIGGLPASLSGSPQSTAEDGDGISFAFTLN